MGQSLDSLSLSLFFIFVLVFLSDRNIWVNNFEMGGWTHPSIEDGHANQLEVVSTGFISPLLYISAKVIPIRYCKPLASLAFGNFWWLYSVPHPPLLHISVQFPNYMYFFPFPSST